MTRGTDDGYSAHVTMELHVNNEVIGVDKVGPDRIVLSESRPVPDGDAKLVIKVGQDVWDRFIILSKCNAVDGTVQYW